MPAPQETSWDILYKLNEATAERLSSHPSITLLVNFFFFLQLLTKQFREKLPPSPGTYKM